MALEIAAPNAVDANFFAEFAVVVDQQHRLAAPPGFNGAHHAGGTRADDDRVVTQRFRGGKTARRQA